MESFRRHITFLLVLVNFQFAISAAINTDTGILYCLSCTAVISPRHCHNIRMCDEGQVCFTEKYTNFNGETLYDIGCHTESFCNSSSVGNPFDITSINHIQQCVECCTGNACNSHGCGATDYPAVRGPLCFSCSQVLDPTLCRTAKICSEDEVCHVHEIHEYGERFFTSTCLQKRVCEAYTTGTIFGKKRNVHLCSKCCHHDLCNYNCDLPFDCLDIHNRKGGKTGVYEIFPTQDLDKPVKVVCDMDLLGGGWTVIQNRNRQNARVNFNTTWGAYKDGFGDVHHNYWLGNSNIYELTTKYNNSLYIKMEKLSDHSVRFAHYSSFSISNETDGFRLSMGTYSGNSQDAFRDHGVIGQKFSTYDKDHGNCAKECGSGWWYGSCTLVNLNAPFFEVHRDPVWNGYISGGTNCVMTEMLIKRN